MTKTIVDNTAASRFDLLVDGERVGEIGYAHRAGGLHLTHTEILPEKREKGLASDFVTLVLESLRTSTSERVFPDCPYIAHWLESNDGYEELFSR
jgi:predicted GNAT family acetyltransferase